MKKSLIFIVGLIVLLSLTGGVFAEVRINEVMASTPSDIYGANCEWIELYSENQTNLTGWTIDTYKQNKTFNYTINDFLVITKNKTIFLNNWNVNESKIIEWSGSGLTDSGDNVSLYDNLSSLISNFSYKNSHENLSWQFCNNSWIEAMPTPGSINSCTQQSQNTSTPANLTEPEISLEMNWDEEDIVNGQEFEIEIKAYNLESEDYDVRVWIEFEDNDTIISDRYGTDDSGEEKWMSGRYYIYGLFDGPGNKTEKVDLRIRGEYEDFEGSAKIFSKMRDIDEISSSIEILEKKEENKEDNSPQPEEAIGKTVGSYEGNSSFTGSVIHLGGLKEKEESGIDEAKTNTSIIYESKNELIKKYSLFGFALLCTALSILLVLNKLN